MSILQNLNMETHIYIDRHIHMHNSPFTLTYFLVDKIGDHIRMHASDAHLLVLKDKKEITDGIPPIIRFSKNDLQMLLDEIWKQGIRPTEHQKIIDSIEPIKQHLDDMRAIVANRLKIELP